MARWHTVDLFDSVSAYFVYEICCAINPVSMNPVALMMRPLRAYTLAYK